MDTKQERREARRRNQRKMKVSGGSVRLLHILVQARAKRAEEATKGKEQQ